MRSRVLGSLVIVLVAQACGGGDKRAPLSAKQTSSPTMLGAVPADSPYVFAQLEPLPQSVRDAWFQYTDRKLATAMQMAKQIPRDFDRSTLGPFERVALAFFDELKGNDLAHWGRDLGLDPSGRFAFYGLSVWPVLRVAVADPVKLRGVVGRLIAAADLGPRVVEETRDGRRYWSLTAKGVTIVAAVLDTEAVAAVVPTGALGESLPLLLGTRQPEHPLAATGRVSELLAAHHFKNLMFGYLDLRQTAAILTGRGRGPLESMLHDATGPVSDVCKADIERLVQIVPRFVIGYHALDGHSFHASLVAEVAPPILHALQSVHAEVPELVPGPAGNPLFAFGAAMNLDVLLPLARDAVTWAKARPFQCEWLDPLNKVFADVGVAVGGSLPPAFQGLRGFALTVDDFRKEPFDVTGSVVIATDRAPDLIALFLQKMPGMSSVALVPDGRPVALPTAAFGLDPATQLHAATRADRVAVAVGRTSPQRVRELVHAKTPQHSPLASFAFDVPRMKALGLVDEDDESFGSDNMTSVVLQLDAKNDGLALDVFGTFPKM